MGVFSFLKRFLSNKRRSNEPVVVNPFLELSARDQDVVREYFVAALAVHRLLQSLHHGVTAGNCELVIDRFDQAEKQYSGLGFLPVMPGSLHYKGSRSLDIFHVERLTSMGLLVRRVSGDLPQFYTAAVRKHAARLQRRKPQPLVTSKLGVLKPRPERNKNK